MPQLNLYFYPVVILWSLFIHFIFFLAFIFFFFSFFCRFYKYFNFVLFIFSIVEKKLIFFKTNFQLIIFFLTNLFIIALNSVFTKQYLVFYFKRIQLLNFIYYKKINLYFYNNNIKGNKILSFLNFIFIDLAYDGQYLFQDPATPIMEGIVNFHHDLLSIQIFIAIFVLWMLIRILMSYSHVELTYYSIFNFLLEKIEYYLMAAYLVVSYNSKVRNRIKVLYFQHYYLNLFRSYNSYINFKYVSTFTNFYKFFIFKRFLNSVENSFLLNQHLSTLNMLFNKEAYVRFRIFNSFFTQFLIDYYSVMYNFYFQVLMVPHPTQSTTAKSTFSGIIAHSTLVANKLGHSPVYKEQFDNLKKREELLILLINSFAYSLFSLDKNKYNLGYNGRVPSQIVHNTTLEIVWTIIPSLILVYIVIPSLALLYAMDEIIAPVITVKIIGNQWYWRYEFSVIKGNNYFFTDYDTNFSGLESKLNFANSWNQENAYITLQNQYNYEYFNLYYFYNELNLKYLYDEFNANVFGASLLKKHKSEIISDVTSWLNQDRHPSYPHFSKMLLSLKGLGFKDPYNSLGFLYRTIDTDFLSKTYDSPQLCDQITKSGKITFESRLSGESNFDYYMLPSRDGLYRLLDTDNLLILPEKISIRLLITSSDVLHCWTIPSFGIKLDACPGRLNQTGLFIKRAGLFYGQCSEICGINHAFMPIVVKSVNFEQFELFQLKYLVKYISKTLKF
jgi:heme/copper-type cytochrome/quinol oxidase subunit 2